MPNLYVEQFNATILTAERANLKLQLRFKGKYLLAISEALLVVDGQITQIDYRYHFQNENNQVIFRYDSTPHFPNLSTFPHHKHLTDTVISAEKPDLTQVLQEASTLAETKD
nr:DUF6516 family protein [Nodosilinea sp. LEGE 07298]